MWQLALRTLRYRKAGFIATFIAVFLGSGLVIACAGLMETGIRVAVPPQRLAAAPVVVSGQQAYLVPKEDPNDTKDMKTVALAERQWLDPAMADELASIDGVERVVAETIVAATVVRDGRPVQAGAQSLGHAWESAQLGPFSLVEGNEPTGNRDVVLDAATASLAGVGVGDQVDVVTRGETDSFRVTGVVSPAERDPQSLLFFADSAIGDLGRHGDQVSAFGLFLRPGVDAEAFQESLEDRFAGQPYLALIGDDRGLAEHPEAVGGRAQLIPLAAVFGGMAVFIAMFVVSSTLGLSIQQRLKEIASLRALGATPRQVRRMIVGEAFFVAIGAAVLGCLPGIVIGPLMFEIISEAGVISPVVEYHQGFLAYLIGPAVALLSALLAARITSSRAAKVNPVEAMAEASVQRKWVTFPRVLFAVFFFLIGIGLFIVTGAFMAGPVASATAGPAVMAWAIGLALISPGLTKVIGRVFAAPVRAAGGVVGYLANNNVRLRSVRMAAAVTPIMLAVGIALSNFYLSTTQEAAATRWFAEDLRADAVVSSATGGLAPDVVEQVRSVPGVEAATRYVTSAGWIDKPYDGSHVSSPWPMQGVDGGSAAQITGITPVQGDLADLTGATAGLPVAQATDMGVGVGDKVTLRLGDREPAEVTVVALYEAKEGYETIMVSAGLLAEHTTTGLAQQILVKAAPGTSPEALMAAVGERMAGVPGAVVGDSSAIITFAKGTETQTWVNYLLVGLITGYTLISVANTLVMATASRKRELGVQRLIGTTPRQVMQMLALEASVVAAIGIVLGTVASVATLMPFSIVVLDRPLPAGPVWIFLAVVVGAFALTLAATLLPARKILAVPSAEAARAAD
ncbi:FtsX-like permease family protein [Saccharothrix sp. BKS2]|uniref:ABC transporter permease n=1 Tax=Saccharothrix sp. BKS2 TaxID=3064400 RepID=UPI0039EB9DE6